MQSRGARPALRDGAGLGSWGNQLAITRWSTAAACPSSSDGTLRASPTLSALPPRMEGSAGTGHDPRPGRMPDAENGQQREDGAGTGDWFHFLLS